MADFFLAPTSHPDLVIGILVEDTKRKKLNNVSNQFQPSQATPKPVKNYAALMRNPAFPRMPAARSLALDPLRIFIRTCLGFFVFMFLSCAVAPNSGVVIDNIGSHNQYFDGLAAGIVYPADKQAGASWQTAASAVVDGPFAGKVSQSFMGRFLKGNWAGIALIDPQGGITTLARNQNQSMISEWMHRFLAREDENRMLRESVAALRRAQDQKKIYLEINLDDDVLFVKMGTQILYKFPIVTGRGYRPRAYGKQRYFSTPRGMMTVKEKEKWPLWYPPSWHWAERGEEAPEVRKPLRGVLGKYRLDLGNAYGIHGTANGRIGRPGKYSHGCIRMNAKDLEIVYKLSDVGTEVYIY